jgi:uncharacterized membrane protein
MARSIPYFRVVVVALGSAGLLAFLLNLTLRDWVAALHLAIVLTFTFITLVLVMRALVVAVIEWIRRKGDDPPGYQRDFDLVA